MWIYVQSSGDLFFNETYVETGYSGALPDGKNKPDKECQKNIGPIPRGYYSIGDEKNKPTPISIPLLADNPSYCTAARDGFLIHGGNDTGTASTGCIIVRKITRERVRDSNDRRMRVVKDSIKSQRLKKRIFARQEEL